MTPAITRKGFLKRAGSGAVAAAATSGALSASARATAALDASFATPYEPNPIIAHPSSWFVYTALLPHVVTPYDVVVCNQELGPLPDLQGFPDLRALPPDATMLLLFIQEPIAVAAAPQSFPDFADAIQLNGTTMHFSDLGGGDITYAGFRNFIGWYVATSGNSLYSIGVNVYVGPNAGPEWADVQSIVNSIHLPA